jgi:hypothetical protein
MRRSLATPESSLISPDYDLPIWAGVLPLKLVAGVAIADSRSIEQIPTQVRNYTR